MVGIPLRLDFGWLELGEAKVNAVKNQFFRGHEEITDYQRTNSMGPDRKRTINLPI
ncbi:hypothetical protein BSG1_16965 [Bacillus sp. SG-1]|nr:hypothetical protein BSG1_16965 [Bacillus sp. SG-1]